MSRTDKLNKQFRQEIASLVDRIVKIDGGLITVMAVETAANLQTMKIFVSVLPEKYFGTALRELRRHSATIARELGNKLKIRKIPKFVWLADTTEAKAAELDELFEQIKEK